MYTNWGQLHVTTAAFQKKNIFKPFSGTSNLHGNTQPVQNSAAVSLDNQNRFVYQSIRQVLIIF